MHPENRARNPASIHRPSQDGVRGGAWIVAAHPGAETIGAASLLLERRVTRVVVATDGAPAERRWWSTPLLCSRGDYAALRRFELEQALQAAGVPGDLVTALAAPDQHAAEHVFELVTDLAALFVRAAPDVVVTHAYEGFHPDQDAVALCVHAASGLLARSGRPVPVLEMRPEPGRGSLFPAAHGRRPAASWTRLLDPQERATKARMLACYRSQRPAPSAPEVTVERFREAPAYDFSRPPQRGRLHYATRGWTTWERFASAALEGLRRLGLPPHAPSAAGS